MNSKKLSNCSKDHAIGMIDENFSNSSMQSIYEVSSTNSQRNDSSHPMPNTFSRAGGGRKISPIECGIPLTFSRQALSTMTNSCSTTTVIRQKNYLTHRQRFNDLRCKRSPPVYYCNATSQSSLGDYGDASPKDGRAKRFPSASAGMELLANRFADLCGTTKRHIRTPKPSTDDHKYSLDQQNVTERNGTLSARNSNSLPLLYTRPTCTLTTTFPVNATNVVTTTVNVLSDFYSKDTDNRPLTRINATNYNFAADSHVDCNHPTKSRTYSQFTSLWDKLQTSVPCCRSNASSPPATPNESDDSSSHIPISYEILEIGANNSDIVQFQQEINAWLKRQSSIIGSAFVLTSNDINLSYCEVCCTEYLEDPINCGDSEYLRTLFDFSVINQNRSQATNEEMIRIQHRHQQIIDNPEFLQEEHVEPAVLDLKQIRDEKPYLSIDGFQSILRKICTMTYANCVQDLRTPSPEGMNNEQESRVHKYESGRGQKSRQATGGSPTRSREREFVEKFDDPPTNSIIGIQAKCGFVSGLVLAHRSEKQKKKDLETILPHISLMATLMSIIDNVEEQKQLARQTKRFLTVTQNVFSSLQDMNELVRNITREAKALVQAEICSLFLLDKEHSELVAEVFEKNGSSDEYLTEIRMPLNQGVVGHVATTGQMLNVKNVADSPYFYKKVDEMTGFTTRNILCFPIKDEKNNLVGVAELCNKIGKKSFTRQDEQCAATLSVYCAFSISHCLLYRKLQEAHRRSHMAAELLVQGSTLSIAPEDILRLTVRDIPSLSSFHRQFDQFSFVPRCIGTGDTYVEASLSMFKALGFIDKYRLRRRTLARFLLMVQKGYRDVPYHNWSHAFAVGHFCYLLIKIPFVMEALSNLERFALLVACLCHDIDHRGTTNAFQLQSKTPLAQLYSSEGSVLERHHFAQTVTILGMEECNIFDQLTRSQYQTVLDHIRETILATDIAAHLRKVRNIHEMVEQGYNNDSTEHRYLLTCLLMTASDLSDQSKDFKNSKLIAENIYKEFFSQGDLEKQMGNKPNVMMDRDRACVPEIQLNFMDTVALPVFQYAARLLPELQSTYDSMLTNRVCWQELDKILQEDGYATGDLDYLHDAELERRVYERLSMRPDDDHQNGRVHPLTSRGIATVATTTITSTANTGEDSAQTSARSATSMSASARTWCTTESSSRVESRDQPTISRYC